MRSTDWTVRHAVPGTRRLAVGQHFRWPALALASPRYFRLLDRLGERVGRPRRGGPEITLAHLAGREFKRLRRAMEGLGDPPSDAALHAVRIRAKRARYAAELAEPVIRKSATRFLRAARTFQDVLGQHDAVVTEGRLRNLATEVPSARVAFVVGRLAERQRSRRRSALASFAGAWRKLRRRGEELSA